MWNELVPGASIASPCHSLPIRSRALTPHAERAEALESAAALLRDPRSSSEAAVLSTLPWLLPASPPAALSVLTARPLDPAAVLAVLPADSDARWQYLDHLIACMSLTATGGSSCGGGQAAAAGAAGLAGVAGGPGTGPGGASRTISRASTGSSSRPASALSQSDTALAGAGSPPPPPPPSSAQLRLAAALAALSPQAQARIHTELATQLVAAILRADLSLRQPQWQRWPCARSAAASTSFPPCPALPCPCLLSRPPGALQHREGGGD